MRWKACLWVRGRRVLCRAFRRRLRCGRDCVRDVAAGPKRVIHDVRTNSRIRCGEPASCRFIAVARAFGDSVANACAANAWAVNAWAADACPCGPGAVFAFAVAMGRAAGKGASTVDVLDRGRARPFCIIFCTVFCTSFAIALSAPDGGSFLGSVRTHRAAQYECKPSRFIAPSRPLAEVFRDSGCLDGARNDATRKRFHDGGQACVASVGP